MYLYLAAAVLVSGVLFHTAWTGWVGFAIDGDSAVKEGYASLVSAYAGYKGMLYSLLIASYYGPVAWVLARRAEGIKPHASENISPEEIDAWRLKKGLAFSYWGAAKTMAGIMGPLVAGVVGPFLQNLPG